MNTRFDDLPDTGRIRIPDFLELWGNGRSKFYQMAAEGKVPRAEKLPGTRTSTLKVGEIRRYFADPAGYKQP